MQWIYTVYIKRAREAQRMDGMPNYIKNRLTISGNAKEVFSFINGDDSIFDFNKIIPMPKELDIEESSMGDDGLKYIYLNATRPYNKRETEEIEKKLKSRNQFEDAIELGKKYMANIAKHGHKTWYGWSSENWGTKWNALEPYVISENCIEFDTAWAGIVSLIEKLSVLFPESLFEYKYADEDTGCNCGHGTIKNGVSEMIYPENMSREAYDLAFELRPDRKDDYTLENGNYKYKGEE